MDYFMAVVVVLALASVSGLAVVSACLLKVVSKITRNNSELLAAAMTLDPVSRGYVAREILRPTTPRKPPAPRELDMPQAGDAVFEESTG